jgi:hypothetical protein
MRLACQNSRRYAAGLAVPADTKVHLMSDRPESPFVKAIMLSMVLLVCFTLAVQADPPSKPDADPDHAAKMTQGRELFTKQVRQVLIDQCVKCHGGEKTRSGLDLVTREGLLKGGDNGPSIIVGKAKLLTSKSRICRRSCLSWVINR